MGTETEAQFRLLVCPYLPLKDPFGFDHYTVGPLSSLDEWRDETFRQLGMDVLESYRDSRGERLSDPAVIAHRDHGLNIPDAERMFPSLQAAIHFAVLDRNPNYDPKTQAWRIPTSDNSTIHLWRLNPDGLVGTELGVVVRRIDFGWKASDAEFEVSPPLHLHMPSVIQLDEDILSGVHASVSQADDDNPDLQRIHTSIRWLARAWTNSEALGWDDRIVMLKTAFEALLGESRNPEAMEALRSIFERCHDRYGDEMNAEALLWSPTDVETHQTTLDIKRNLTDLEDWFLAFTRCRNDIIHKGGTDNLKYDNGSSTYNGPYPHVAERVLRETIKVRLDELGFGRLWESRSRRILRREIEKHWGRSTGSD